MTEVVLWGGIFALSLVVLVRASHYLTDAAEEIGLFFNLPAFLIGALILTMGTSLPELISSIIAVSGGYSEIVAGSVVGSNITNIFLILGISAVFSINRKFDHSIDNTELVALLGATLLLVISSLDGKFTFFEGVLSIFGFLIFLYFSLFSEESAKNKAGFFEKFKQKFIAKRRKKFPIRSLEIMIISAFFVFIAAKYVVASVIYFSDLVQVGKSIIAASAVALGTSLPELVVSWTAARKGRMEVAIGNILGSNIFNSLVVMGISALVGDLIISKNILVFGLPMMIGAIVMYIFIIRDKEVSRWEGSFLLIFYVFYIGKLFGWI